MLGTKCERWSRVMLGYIIRLIYCYLVVLRCSSQVVVRVGNVTVCHFNEHFIRQPTYWSRSGEGNFSAPGTRFSFPCVIGRRQKI